jgi:transcriptional regulator with XRE-family HTH domain
MRLQKRRTTVIVAGGALAIASVGYGLGTQADDGTAIAESSPDSGQELRAGPGLLFERGAPPGFSDLADKLGVEAEELRQALRDFHGQKDADRRDEFATELADALGISADRVKSSFEGLHQKREDRFAARLADALGVGADKVKAALEKLKGDDGPVPFGDFAQTLADELGLDVSDVRAALMEIRPFHGERHRHRDAPLRQLANALGVSRADLRAALVELRQGAENRWQQHHDELAQFLADRFDLDVDEVSDALAATAPPLMSPHRRGLPDHPRPI